MIVRLLLSVLFVVAGQSVSMAKPLVCPTNPPPTNLVPPQEMASLVATSNPVDRAAILNRTVATLRDRGMAASGIVDSLISTYCPTVAANASLSDQQKTTNVRSFAAQAVQAAYAFTDEEDIILNVSVPTNIMSAINEKARLARMSPQEWAAAALVNAAK